MPKDSSFHDYVMSEVFAGTEGITSRSMFGGWGIYKDGIFFALIAEGELYFKVNDSNRKDYEKYDSKPFVYSAHTGKKVTMSYWQLPADIMEDREELATWIQKSVEVAKKSRNK